MVCNTKDKHENEGFHPLKHCFKKKL